MKDYTVKEIAELLEVSKPTVQKVVNDLSLEPVRIEKNKYRFYSYADTVGIIKVIKSDFDFSKLQSVFEKSPNETAKPQDSTEKQLTDFFFVCHGSDGAFHPCNVLILQVIGLCS